MKISVLPAVALLSLLALHAARELPWGALRDVRLWMTVMETEMGNEENVANYDDAGSEGLNSQFLNLDKLQSAFKSDDFLNWHVFSDFVRKAFPFINWDFFPKVKGLRSATPDSQ